VEVRDRDGYLAGSVTDGIFNLPVPAAIATIGPFECADDVLSDSTLEKFCLWAEAVERFLREGLATLPLL
jgi:hypothetical protein